VEGEFAPAEGLADVQFEAAARLHAGVHLGLEEAECPAPLELRPVEGEVGALEQAIRVGAVARRHRDADAGADGEQLPLDHVGAADQVDDAARQDPGLLEVRYAALDHDELVSADARDGIAGTERGAEALGDLGQKGIADRVTQRVVDGLEPVEVHQEHRAGAVGGLHLDEGILQAVAQVQAVRQAGQGVEARPLAGRALGGAAQGDVLEGDGPAPAGPAGAAEGLDADLERQPRVQDLEGEALAAVQGAPDLGEQGIPAEGQEAAEGVQGLTKARTFRQAEPAHHVPRRPGAEDQPAPLEDEKALAYHIEIGCRPERGLSRAGGRLRPRANLDCLHHVAAPMRIRGAPAPRV
jgi:hypothetical protein